MLGRRASLLPAAAADPAEFRPGLGQAHVAGNQMRLLQRHVQSHLVVELQRNDFAGAGGRLELGEAAKDRDAVLEVDDEIALDELGEIEQLVDLRRSGGRSAMEHGPPLPLATENLGFRHQNKSPRLGRQGQDGRPAREGPGGAVRHAETFVDCAPQEARLQLLQRRIRGEDLPGARLLAVLGHGQADRIAFPLPADHLLEKAMAGFLLDLQPFVGDQRIVGVSAVVGEAFRVPGLFVPGPLEQSGGFVEVAHGDRGGAAGENGFEGGRPGRPAARSRRRRFGGDQAERFFQRRRFDEDQTSERIQIISQPGDRRRQPQPGRSGKRDLFQPVARALGYRVKRANVLDLVTQEIEPAGLARGHRIDVDDPPAHGVLPGRFANRLGIIVEVRAAVRPRPGTAAADRGPEGVPGR